MRIGDRFGKLTIMSEPYHRGKYLYVDCKCECGSTKMIRESSILNGNSRCCGCLARTGTRKKHGLRNHPLYNTHHDMIRRCYDEGRKDYKHYGARGIVVCDRWRDEQAGLANFIEDMGERPKGGELERIDVNGNYNKENCKWLTRRGQTNNTRFNKIIRYRGYSMTLSEWAHLLGVPATSLRDRVEKLNHGIEEALEKPFLAKTCSILYEGKTYTIGEFLQFTPYTQNSYGTIVRRKFCGDVGSFTAYYGGEYSRKITNKRLFPEVIQILKGEIPPPDSYSAIIVEKYKEQPNVK